MTTISTYNKSEIMKSAWETFKNYEGLLNFSECLKAAWANAKKTAQSFARKAASLTTTKEAPSRIDLIVGKTKYYCGNENSGMSIVTIK